MNGGFLKMNGKSKRKIKNIILKSITTVSDDIYFFVFQFYHQKYEIHLYLYYTRLSVYNMNNNNNNCNISAQQNFYLNI